MPTKILQSDEEEQVEEVLDEECEEDLDDNCSVGSSARRTEVGSRSSQRLRVFCAEHPLAANKMRHVARCKATARRDPHFWSWRRSFQMPWSSRWLA